MPLFIHKVEKYRDHRLLVTGTMHPNWWEWLLGYRKGTAFAFVGRGTKWYHHPKTKPAPKRVAKQLEELTNYKNIY